MTALFRRAGVALPLVLLLLMVEMLRGVEPAVRGDDFDQFKLKSNPELALEEWHKVRAPSIFSVGLCFRQTA